MWPCQKQSHALVQTLSDEKEDGFLKQRVWFVTGCSSGIGCGIAEAALRNGDKVAVTARHLDTLTHFVGHYPERTLALRLDLNDPESMRQAVAAVENTFGQIDVLVNNAGHGYRAAIEESEPEAVTELFQTNFFGPMDLAKMVLPGMRRRRSGTIVQVSSIGAVRGAPGNGYYSAAKGALELASEALAKEVQGLGIRVMLVEPGAFRTGFYGERLAESAQTIGDYDALAASYRKSAQLNRGDQPGDPDKAGEIIAEIAGHNDAPFRLLLGSDAVTSAEQTLTARLRELHAWADVSRQTDLADK